MKNTKHFVKRGISLALALMMCLSLLPTTAFADGYDQRCPKGGLHNFRGSQPTYCNKCGSVYFADGGWKSGQMCADGNHNYGGWETVSAATCTQKAKQERTCSWCGNVDKQEIGSTTEHSYSVFVETTATCGEDGKATYKCANCDDTTEVEDEATGEHNYAPATCLAAKTCTVCGATDGGVDTSNHAEDCEVGEWTTTEDGRHIQKRTCGVEEASHNAPTAGCVDTPCTICGLNVPGTEHSYDYENGTRTVSCGEKGYTTFVCVNCGDKKVVEDAEVTPHVDGCIDSWVENEDGTHVKKFSTCGAEVEDSEHNPKFEGVTCMRGATCSGAEDCDIETGADTVNGHNYGTAWETEEDATTHWHVCANGCGVKGDVAGHDYGTYTWDETEDKWVATCVCGATDKQTTVPENHEHRYTGGNCMTEAKCECGAVGKKDTTKHVDGCAPGEWTVENTQYHVQRFTMCGTKTDVPNNNHRTKSGSVIKGTPATCTKDGWTNGTACGVEGCPLPFEAQAVIPADGHKFEEVKKIPATCTEPGVKEHWICKTCNKNFLTADDLTSTDYASEKDLTIKATGHSMTYHDAVAATCTTDGNKKYWTCDVCEKVFSDAEGKTETTIEEMTVAAKGHTPGTPVREKKLDCTTGGRNACMICKVCDGYYPLKDRFTTWDYEKDVLIAAPGHNIVEHGEAKAATCTEAGNKEYWYCDRCKSYGLSESIAPRLTWGKIEIKALNHDFKETWSTDGTYHWYDCSRCDATDSKTQHTYGNWYRNEKTNVIEHKCNVCGSIEAFTPTEQYPVPIEHDCDQLIVEGRVDPKCTVDGVDVGTKCSICGSPRSGFNPIPATGHSYGDWFRVFDPTETVAGMDARYCENAGCDAFDVRIVEALGEGEVEIDENDTPLAGLPFDLDPEEELTRGHLIYILYWFEGEPDAAACTFTDAYAEAYYYEALGWAEENGIAVAYPDGTFKPEETVTRGDMEEILNLYNQYLEVEEEVTLAGDRGHKMLWREAEVILNDFFSIPAPF